ncbi:hypothetical protein [Rhodococcoides fascians]|uniref:hypothetical protein n=1 Tax=Rhodococcoides fascians TaxID=1828 RepID=UPI0012D3343E|nr:hypothetical protein [Rhodococcus fascians]
MTYPSERVGHGRWTPVLRPSVGVLWVTDAGSLAFIPQNGIDPTPMVELIQTFHDAGKSADEAFDALLLIVGSAATAGDVDDWRPDRVNGRRTQIGPVLTSTYEQPL